MTIPPDPATQADPGFVLCLYRTTDHPDEMGGLLEALGLHRTVLRDQDGTSFWWGRAGMVALLDTRGEGTAPAGETQLSFETADLDAARVRLARAGHELVVWDDEGEQRSAGLTDPSGRGIFVRESMRDAHDRGSDFAWEPLDVVGVRESRDLAADETFFAAFGFVRTGGDDSWAPLADATDGGVLGLHAPWGEPDRRPVAAGTPALVHLGFQTEGDLAALADRVAAAGFPAEVVADRGRPVLVVTDPDGVRLEVHAVA